MKKIKYIALFVAIISSVAAGGYWLGKQDSGFNNQSYDTP